MIDKFGEPRTIEQVEEPKQDDLSKEVRHEFRGRWYICNEVRNMKKDCTGKSFKPITNFYYYNCHGYGHKVVDYKKPKFDGNNVYSRFLGTLALQVMKEGDHREDLMMEEDLMEKGNSLYITSVTILDILQGTVEDLKVRM